MPRLLDAPATTLVLVLPPMTVMDVCEVVLRPGDGDGDGDGLKISSDIKVRHGMATSASAWREIGGQADCEGAGMIEFELKECFDALRGCVGGQGSSEGARTLGFRC